METIRVNTDRREQLVDITAEVRGSVESSGVTSGMCVLWSMHTTAGLTVNEISYRLGYQNMESFIRMFKKSVGMTPTEYRESAEAEGKKAGPGKKSR